MWQVCLELNVPSLFAVGADPGDPHLRADSVPQGPKQGSYLRNRPVMRLRRPAMSVARESMIRKLVVVKFLASAVGTLSCCRPVPASGCRYRAAAGDVVSAACGRGSGRVDVVV